MVLPECLGLGWSWNCKIAGTGAAIELQRPLYTLVKSHIWVHVCIHMCAHRCMDMHTYIHTCFYSMLTHSWAQLFLWGWAAIWQTWSATNGNFHCIQKINMLLDYVGFCTCFWIFCGPLAGKTRDTFRAWCGLLAGCLRVSCNKKIKKNADKKNNQFRWRNDAFKKTPCSRQSHLGAWSPSMGPKGPKRFPRRSTWFSMIFMEFHRFSSMFIDFHQFSLSFIDFHWFS